MVRTDKRASAGVRPAELDGDGPTAAVVDAVALNAMAREGLGTDPVAMRRFLIGIAPTIRYVCRGVMGRHHPDLEDAIQDCLIDTMRAMPRFRFEGSVVHYVTKIAMRLAIAARGRTTLRSGRFPALEEHRVAERQSSGDGHGLQQAELIRQIVRDLSRVQAEAIILRLLLGFSIEEIASITGASINTVKTRLRLGKNSLRQRLEHGVQVPFETKRPTR